MNAIPVSFKEACAFVDLIHRHHIAPQGDKFRFGCEEDGKLVGVVMVGRPVARRLDDGFTVEVLRLCTDGTRNACSFLYSRAARIAKEMGYKRIITYILSSETGASLKASGWKLDEDNCGGGQWKRNDGERDNFVQLSFFSDRAEKYPTEKKQRWVKEF